jgi:hypothetical protein
MNNRRDKLDDLLAETFHGDWNGGDAVRVAQIAAAQARRHRRNRRAIAVSVCVVVLAGIAVVSVPPRPAAPAPAVAGSTTAPSVRAYDVISDAELMRTIADRPVAMVQRSDGSHEFVLIGEELLTPAVFE